MTLGLVQPIRALLFDHDVINTANDKTVTYHVTLAVVLRVPLSRDTTVRALLSTRCQDDRFLLATNLSIAGRNLSAHHEIILKPRARFEVVTRW